MNVTLPYGIPVTEGVKDLATRNVLDAIIANMRVRGGDIGAVTDRNLLLGEMIDLGFVGQDAKSGTLYGKSLPSTQGLKTQTGKTVNMVPWVLAVGAIDATAGLATGQHDTSILLPTGAYVTNARYHVTTPFASGGAASVSIDQGAALAEEIMAKKLIGALGTVGVGKQTGKLATYSTTTTAPTTVFLQVYVAALTAGKMTIYLQYAVAS